MKDQQILISDLLILLFVLAVIDVIWNLIMAKAMEKIARQKGYGEEFNCFMICFWLGMIGCLYVIALPDLKQREQLDRIIKLLDSQVPANPPQQDVAWKLQKLPPVASKKDGSAEAYLCKVGMTPEEYACKSLAIFKEDSVGECEMCKKQQKARKHCGVRRNGAFSDISICADCINVFAEYNPNAVFDLEIKKPN